MFSCARTVQTWALVAATLLNFIYFSDSYTKRLLHWIIFLCARSSHTWFLVTAALQISMHFWDSHPSRLLHSVLNLFQASTRSHMYFSDHDIRKSHDFWDSYRTKLVHSNIFTIAKRTYMLFSYCCITIPCTFGIPLEGCFCIQWWFYSVLMGAKWTYMRFSEQISHTFEFLIKRCCCNQHKYN